MFVLIQNLLSSCRLRCRSGCESMLTLNGTLDCIRNCAERMFIHGNFWRLTGRGSRVHFGGSYLPGFPFTRKLDTVDCQPHALPRIRGIQHGEVEEGFGAAGTHDRGCEGECAHLEDIGVAEHFVERAGVGGDGFAGGRS
jgi:hypothetical protein